MTWAKAGKKCMAVILYLNHLTFSKQNNIGFVIAAYSIKRKLQREIKFMQYSRTTKLNITSEPV